MKILQVLAAIGFVAAGVALLCVPSHAAVVGPTRFTVTDAGTVGKPDVVMIPGLASSKSVWDGEVKLLAPNYRLHVLQLAGFAGAPAGPNATGAILPGVVEELHQYIGTLAGAGKMHPVVIGHSLGGLLTLMLADKYPGDVRKMVIVDSLPYYGAVFTPSATPEMLKPQAQVMRDQIIAMPADQYAMMQPMMMAQMVKDPDGLKLVSAASIASDRTVVANAMFEDMQTDLRADIAGIKTPTLVLYEHDTTLKQPDAGQYEATVKAGYKSMPNVTLVPMDGARHFVMYDQPVKFDAAVEGFLK